MNFFSQRYETALEEHLKPGSPSDLKKAARLGSQAVSLGLGTLEVAKTHERALLAVIASAEFAHQRDGMVRRAQVFFIEVITPIERTYLTAARAKLHCNKMSQILLKRTNELAASKREFRKGNFARKSTEKALQKESEHYEKLLQESRSLQQKMRCMAHQIIFAQEKERGQISRELHNEVAQVLLGINVRVASMGQKGTRDAQDLLGEIASAQSLVDESVNQLDRTVREFRTPHEK